MSSAKGSSYCGFTGCEVWQIGLVVFNKIILETCCDVRVIGPTEIFVTKLPGKDRKLQRNSNNNARLHVSNRAGRLRNETEHAERLP